MATVMTKEQILSDIRRVAKQRGGRVSLDAYLAATGIKEHQLLGTFWATWNEAVAEAGLPTSRLRAPKQKRVPSSNPSPASWNGSKSGRRKMNCSSSAAAMVLSRV